MDCNQPLVSIIMPNYNCEKYIKETLESVLNQTYKNWELIIIDDCSKDRSVEIIENYMKIDKRIRIERFLTNKGAALARNRAIEISNGKYIAFLDSDDLWLSKKLEKQIEVMEREKIDFIFSEYEEIDEYGNKLNKIAKTIQNLTYKKMLFHCFTGCLTVVYNQEKIGKIYGPNVKKSNDYALFLQILKKSKKAKGINQVLAFYRIRKNSISRNKLKKIKPHLYLLNKIEKISLYKSIFYIFTNVLIKVLWKYKKNSIRGEV